MRFSQQPSASQTSRHVVAAVLLVATMSADSARAQACTLTREIKVFVGEKVASVRAGTVIDPEPPRGAWSRVLLNGRSALVAVAYLDVACQGGSPFRDRTSTRVPSVLERTPETAAAKATLAPAVRRPASIRAIPKSHPPAPVTGPMADRRLTLVRREVGNLSPKSIVAIPGGRVFAQNMVYKHSVTVFDIEGNRLRDIPDRVPRSLLGLPGKGFVQGGPVEGAVSADGTSFYVSNYSMFGAGIRGTGNDGCRPPIANSYVYEIDVETLEIKRAIPVGAVPKFLAVTHDGKKLLVSNWCGRSISMVDLTGREPTVKIQVGSLPRGIAIDPNDSVAYVACLGSSHIAVVDLAARAVVRKLKAGHGPRHLVMTTDGRLFASLCGESRVVQLDTQTGKILASARTGRDPRSIALSSDETAVYVANYGEGTLAVIDIRTMKVVQKLPTGPSPIGVTFEPQKERVWVSCYGGSVRLYDSRGAAPHRSVLALTDRELRAH